MLERLRKQTCSWQSAWSASGCGNIRDCLADTATAVSATILILSSKMLFEIYWCVSSCHKKSWRNLETKLSRRHEAHTKLVSCLGGGLCLEGSGKKKISARHVCGFNGNEESPWRILCPLLQKKENRSELTKVFTFTMFAISFIARLADAFIWPNGVLADCVDAAVVKHLCALIHI